MEVLFIFLNHHFLLSFRMKLEYYEQSCAVDSVTKKCAGSPNDCRSAILGILGTDLRTTCACKGTDTTQLYECLGWQRLLWVNPCVGKLFKSQIIISLMLTLCIMFNFVHSDSSSKSISVTFSYQVQWLDDQILYFFFQ